jgi:hypothetical protein
MLVSTKKLRLVVRQDPSSVENIQNPRAGAREYSRMEPTRFQAPEEISQEVRCHSD